MSTEKYKHLTEEDRIEIEDCLRSGVTFKEIAKRIGKDQTTVSKEVRKHLEVIPARGTSNGSALPICQKLLKAPFVCNGCIKKAGCGLEKHYYRARPAHAQYRETLVESRTGLPLTKEAFYCADEILTDGVKKGQHIFHIIHSHNLGMSAAAVYRNINKGYLSVSRMDLPRAVKFKPRKSHPELYVPSAVKRGHLYSDFTDFISTHEIDYWVEMDTVIGRPGGKTIMTFLFTSCSFMLGILLNDKTSAEASDRIRVFKQHLSNHGVSFGTLFPLILTDNGVEFSNIHAFTDSLSGEKESDLFFCDPYCSCEKPRVEKNHTLFRDIVPKGASFDAFSQEDVNFIFSHVNNVKRKKLNNKTPFEMFCFLYGNEHLSGWELASLLGISPVAANDVSQSPNLLKQLPSLHQQG